MEDNRENREKANRNAENVLPDGESAAYGADHNGTSGNGMYAEPENVREIRETETIGPASPVKGDYTELLGLVEQQRKRGKRWKALAFLFLALFLISVLSAVFFIIRKERTETVIGCSDVTLRYENELKNRVAEYNSGDHAFHAEITTFLGYEYVKLTDGTEDGSFWFRNEYPVERSEDFPYNAFYYTEDGITRLSVSGDLSSENWDRLFPVKKTWQDRTWYLFFDYGDSTEVEYIENETGETIFGTTLPECVLLISSGKNEVLYAYPEELLQAAFSYNFVVSESGRAVMSLGYRDYSYLFEASDTVITQASAEGNRALDLGSHLALSYTENGIRFVASVRDADGLFYGEYDGVLVPGEDGLTVEDGRFGVYVSADYEDPDGDRIITPRTEYLEERMTISHTNGRYYLPRYEKVAAVSYDWSLLDQENMFWTMKDEDGNVTSEIGIDVSKHQGEIDWKQVAEAGIEFAYIRVGFRGSNEGTLELDEYALSNLQGAKENGIKVGVYFYSQAITVEEGIEEAEFVLSVLDGMELDYEIVWDTEYYEREGARGNTTSRALRTEIGKAFCETVSAAGYTPMVYSNTYWSILYIDRDELSDYPFWFAYYGDTISYTYDFKVLQYSDSGSVPGIEGDCDLDIRFR